MPSKLTIEASSNEFADQLLPGLFSNSRSQNNGQRQSANDSLFGLGGIFESEDSYKRHAT